MSLSPRSRSVDGSRLVPSPTLRRFAGAWRAAHCGADRSGLLLVGHGSSRCDAPRRHLTRLARSVAARVPFADVRTTTIVGGSSIVDTVRRFHSADVTVFPVYMADGYTLRKGVRDPLEAAFKDDGTNAIGFVQTSVRVLLPLGLHRRIAEIAVDTATASFARRGISPDRGTVLLVAHGTPRNPASRQATELQAQRIAASGRFGKVEVAYLEQDPLVSDVLAMLSAPVAVIGMFASTGMHASVDIDEAITAFPGLDIDYLGPIGEDERIADLIAEIVSSEKTADIALSHKKIATPASVMCG